MKTDFQPSKYFARQVFINFQRERDGFLFFNKMKSFEAKAREDTDKRKITSVIARLQINDAVMTVEQHCKLDEERLRARIPCPLHGSRNVSLGLEEIPSIIA